MTRLIFFTLLCFGITTVYCNYKPKSIRLSKYDKWPDGLTIQTFYYGGMIPSSNVVYISKDSCSIEYTESDNYRNKIHKDFKLSASELDNLLKDLVKSNIDKLGVEKLSYTVYDAPSHGIVISIGTQSVNISNGATEKITEKNSGDFSKCVNIITQIAQKKTVNQASK